MSRSRRDVLKMGAIVPAALLVGCGDKNGNGNGSGAQAKGTCVLCCMCGQVKGSDLCC